MKERELDRKGELCWSLCKLSVYECVFVCLWGRSASLAACESTHESRRRYAEQFQLFKAKLANKTQPSFPLHQQVGVCVCQVCLCVLGVCLYVRRVCVCGQTGSGLIKTRQNAGKKLKKKAEQTLQHEKLNIFACKLKLDRATNHTQISSLDTRPTQCHSCRSMPPLVGVTSPPRLPRSPCQLDLVYESSCSWFSVSFAISCCCCCCLVSCLVSSLVSFQIICN